MGCLRAFGRLGAAFGRLGAVLERLSVVVQGGQELRQHRSGTRIVIPWGFMKSTKPVCRKLQPTNLQLQTTELHDSKDYRNYKMQSSKLQTCQLTNLQSFPSQPGGPQGAGGLLKVRVCATWWQTDGER